MIRLSNPSSNCSNPPSQPWTYQRILPSNLRHPILVISTISTAKRILIVQMRTMEKAQVMTKARETRALGAIGALGTRSAKGAASATGQTQMSQRKHQKSLVT